MKKIFCVLLKRRWDGDNAWTTEIRIGPRPIAGQIGVLWAAECRAKNAEEAKGVVMEWLARGRPESMIVTEIYSDFVGEHGKRNYEDH